MPRAARKFPPTSEAALTYLGFTEGETEAHTRLQGSLEAGAAESQAPAGRSRTPELKVLASGRELVIHLRLSSFIFIDSFIQHRGTPTLCSVCGLPGEPLAGRQVP